MFNAICKLLAALFVGWFLLFVSYKIGVGLGYWGMFVACVIGLAGGVISSVAKIVLKKRTGNG